MEDEKILNENISVADEEIEEVAGGSSPILGKKFVQAAEKQFPAL